MSTSSVQSPEVTGSPGPRLGLILAACCLGSFLTVFDSSVLNVAIPAIDKALHFTPTTLHWVVNAFLIPACGFLLLAGRLNDLFGHRRVFLIGTAIFTLSSLIAGLANSAGVLIAARGFQGMGAAILAPATLTVLTRSFTDPVGRAKAFGIWSGAGGTAGAVAVVVGGLITEWFGWRWVMLINVPFGLLLIWLIMKAVEEYKAADADTKIDVPGAVSVTLGIGALVFAIAESDAFGWGSARVLIALIVAVASFVFFVYDQAKLATHPLVPLSIFRVREISASNFSIFALGAGMIPAIFFYTLLMQQVLGYSPSQAGYGYLPLSFGIFVGAAGVGGFIPKVGPKATTVAGFLIGSLGLLWLSTAGVGSTFWGTLFGATAVFGIGTGVVLTSLNMVGTSGVSEDQKGLASGLIHTTQGLGNSIGLVILVAVSASAILGSVAPDGTAPPAVLADGYQAAFLGTVVAYVLGIVAAFGLPKFNAADFSHGHGAESAEPPSAATDDERSKVGAVA